MNHAITMGIFWHLIGAASAACFYAPFKKVKGWSWETMWSVGGTVSWLILPWTISAMLLPDFWGYFSSFNASTLLRHEGIIPRTHILNSLNAKHAWDGVQRYWHPVVDENGRTSVDGISIAGDGTYVHGGDASMLKGAIAGVEIARRLGVISDAEAAYRSGPARRQLRAMRIARGFLRYVFAPNPAIFNVPDETLVCRCECVTAGDIRKAVAEGFRDVNEVKRFTRCGMGQCQGRMCGPALAEITAAAQSKAPDAVGCLQVRQPFRPVSLENYCNLNLPG